MIIEMILGAFILVMFGSGVLREKKAVRRLGESETTLKQIVEALKAEKRELALVRDSGRGLPLTRADIVKNELSVLAGDVSAAGAGSRMASLSFLAEDIISHEKRIAEKKARIEWLRRVFEAEYAAGGVSGSDWLIFRGNVKIKVLSGGWLMERDNLSVGDVAVSSKGVFELKKIVMDGGQPSNLWVDMVMEVQVFF